MKLKKAISEQHEHRGRWEISYDELLSFGNSHIHKKFFNDLIAHIQRSFRVIQRKLGVENGEIHPEIDCIIGKLKRVGGDPRRALTYDELQKLIAFGDILDAVDSVFVKAAKQIAFQRGVLREQMQRLPYSPLQSSLYGQRRTPAISMAEQWEMAFRQQPGVLQALVHMGYLGNGTANGHRESHSSAPLERAIAEHMEKIQQVIPAKVLISILDAKIDQHPLRRHLRRGLKKLFRPSDRLAQVHRNAADIYAKFQHHKENVLMKNEFPLHEHGSSAQTETAA